MIDSQDAARQDNAARVYAFIQQYIQRTGIAPSQREIALGAYIARSSVGRYLELLAAQGRITYFAGVPRGISLHGDDDAA